MPDNVAELDVALEGWPPGTRAICRREQPHPGAQLRLWDVDGWRHQVTLTNSDGDALALERRQRGHARVENVIKALRDTGLDRMPFRSFAANTAWLELVMAANNLLCWLRTGCLDGELSRAEPKTLRYRLLHTAGRVVRRARRVILRLPRHWPWVDALANAYRRVALIPA
jgi:Transposase DDE domain group 1